MSILDAFRRELRQGGRTLARTPAFTIIAIVTLMLGIGAAAAVFTLLDAIVLRPLPYPAADRLVSIAHPVSGDRVPTARWGVSSAGYFYFRREAHTLASTGVYVTGLLAVSSNEGATRVPAAHITSSIFDVLGARAAVGRLLRAADDVPNGSNAVVLGYDFWQQRFGGDPTIVGRTIQIEAQPMLVVGVAARGVDLPTPSAFESKGDLADFRVDLWIPLQLDPAARPINSHPYSMIARLAPGATVQDAQRELATLTTRLPEVASAAYSHAFMQQYHFGMSVISLRDEVVGATARVLWVVFAAVALVLLVAAANVANLFLVRLETRRRDGALRAALGAGWSHLAAHYFAESLLVVLVAAAGGLLLAWVALRVFVAVAPSNIPRLTAVGLGWPTVACALGLALLLACVLGLIPLAARRGADGTVIREGARGLSVSRRRRLVRDTLVAVQMALALVLLAAAGLMLRTFESLRQVRPGFEPRGTVAVEVHLPWSRYQDWGPVAAFHRTLAERIAALPGVEAVGGGTDLPLESFEGCSSVWAEGHGLAPGEEAPCVKTPEVEPGYFKALGIPVRGRVPDWHDLDAGTGAVVVTRAFAQRSWPGEDPIGRGVKGNGSKPPFYRVVGVVDDLRANGLEKPPVEAVFFPILPLPKAWLWVPPNDMQLVVRSSLDDPTTLVPAIRRTVAALDSTVPVVHVRTMSSVLSHSLARVSFILTLLAIAAGMALLLSAVGTYGVIAYLVTQRRSEIGLRMALGAHAHQVTALVVGHSLRLAGIGLVVGLVAALLATRVLASLLYGVRASDPATFVVAPLVLLVVAVTASVVPARRATRVDPVEALRAE